VEGLKHNGKYGRVLSKRASSWTRDTAVSQGSTNFSRNLEDDSKI